MANYSIKDLERISGIKAHTIRIWERRYKLIEPERTQTNIRFYTDCDLKRLLNVSILNHNGIKISHIAELTDDEIKSRVLDLSIDGRCNDVVIESLMVAMLELDERKFVNSLSASIIKSGFESSVENIIFPFLERIGFLWQAGTINPAQEHFISNLVRQKLFVAIDNEIQSGSATGMRIIMFLPENELHEIGLLFYNLMARKEGLEVIYLGQSVPMDDLVKVNKLRKADMFMTMFVASRTGDEVDSLINSYSQMFGDTPFFVSGFQMRDYKNRLPDNFSIISSVKEFRNSVRLLKYSE